MLCKVTVLWNFATSIAYDCLQQNHILIGNPELCWQLVNLVWYIGEPVNSTDTAIGKLQKLKRIIPFISL